MFLLFYFDLSSIGLVFLSKAPPLSLLNSWGHDKGKWTIGPRMKNGCTNLCSIVHSL